MYCRNCGNEVSEKAIMCVACGTPPMAGDKYCYNCKAETDSNTTICMKCGVGLKGNNFAHQGQEGKDWLTALLLCIFLGTFGIHRFYTNHIGIGIAQLLTLGGCGIWALVDIILIATGSLKDGEGRPLVRR
jgi:TM2 domain-containing membrane protein YozV